MKRDFLCFMSGVVMMFFGIGTFIGACVYLGWQSLLLLGPFVATALGFITAVDFQYGYRQWSESRSNRRERTSPQGNARPPNTWISETETGRLTQQIFNLGEEDVYENNIPPREFP